MNFTSPATNRRRRGTTVADLLVAATLLAAMMTTVMTITLRSGRLRQQTRQHQLALDELSNQLERILSLDATARDDAIRDLKPSEHLVNSLPGCTLAAKVEDSERIVLSLNWDRTINSTPVILTGWLDPTDQQESQP